MLHRYGLMESVESDCWSHSVGQFMVKNMKGLRIAQKFFTQASGEVEKDK